MNTRREFILKSAAAASIGMLGAQSSLAGGTSAARRRRVWALSDLHIGHAEDGKDGAEWFEGACKDMGEAGISIDHALSLGDLTHNGSEPQLRDYLKIRDNSGIHQWHELAGNHEYEGNKSAAAYIRMIRDIRPYSLVEGNIAWLFLSDEAGGVEGNLTEESCGWLETELAKHRDKVVIVCSHQLVKDTVLASEMVPRYIHPADRIAGIIAKSRIDLWLCGHEHHSPYGPRHIVRKGQTTYINIASLNHAYGTGSSQSCVLEFTQDAREIVVRRRDHDTRSFLETYETRIPLPHPIRLPVG